MNDIKATESLVRVDEHICEHVNNEIMYLWLAKHSSTTTS